MLIRLKKGLDIPILGAPQQRIEEAPPVSRFALTAHEYRGLSPKMMTEVGAKVALGQPLFTHKAHPEIRYVAPAAGTVVAIHRGARRVLQSIVIEADGDERREFEPHHVTRAMKLERDQIVEHLLEGGLWPAFRTRPYSKTPAPHAEPRAIFVNAMDTEPLAADPQAVVADAAEGFNLGLHLIEKLTDGPVYVCVAAGSEIEAAPEEAQVHRVEFGGPHPAGLPGTHVHHLDPVHGDKIVWTIHYQDAIAIGEFFLSGVYPTTRVVALGGPAVREPCLLRTRIGASIEELCRDRLRPGQVRLIAGSPLSGCKAQDWSAYVGRFHLQIAALFEHGETPFLAWIRPGLRLFSISRAFLPAWLRRNKRLAFNCMQNGSPRAIVPIGLYERVLPLDLPATQLLKALVVMDTDVAQQLGCLELDEEDLALCSYVCPSKHEFGPLLRATLDKIEKEG